MYIIDINFLKTNFIIFFIINNRNFSKKKLKKLFYFKR